MAARSDAAPARWRGPFLGWLDGIEAGWAIPLLLVGFVAVWMVFLAIAYLCGDLHADVLETWTFGRKLDWGNSKHPPLMGWVARAWTSVFPLTNWSFQLMALINSAVALWAVDVISRRFVSGDKRMVVLLLLMLTSTYQLHAQRFNANAVLLAVWPIATYCFLRSFETRRAGWAIACGTTAALAMLGKYYSVFLLASFILGALAHPERRAYFGSPAPWISAAVGLAALGPHLYWLATTGATPFSYALATHAGKAVGPALMEGLIFLLGIAAMLALPAATWVLIAGSRLKKVPADFRTMNPGLWLLFLVSVGTIALPVITSVAVGSSMQPIWALQGLFLFPILVVCGAGYPIERFYSVNLLVVAIGIAVAAAFVVAPVHAVYRNIHPLHEGRNFYRQAAIELTRQWHQQTDVALPAVGGDEGLALAVAFYSPDHPMFDKRLVCPVSEAFPQARFDRGWAALCFEEDALCIDGMLRIAAPASRIVNSEVVLQSTLFGWPGATQSFWVTIVPPSADRSPSPAGSTVDDILASRCARRKSD